MTAEPAFCAAERRTSVGVPGTTWTRRSVACADETTAEAREEKAAPEACEGETTPEVREDHVFYAYLVRGVEYTASQDVSLLKQYMPPDLSQVAAVSVRYDPRNPANSIVLAENWTGLHIVEPKKQG